MLIYNAIPRFKNFCKVFKQIVLPEFCHVARNANMGIADKLFHFVRTKMDNKNIVDKWTGLSDVERKRVMRKIWENNKERFGELMEYNQ